MAHAAKPWEIIKKDGLRRNDSISRCHDGPFGLAKNSLYSLDIRGIWHISQAGKRNEEQY